MTTLRQTTAFGPGVYRGQPFTRERLQSFVDGTNKAIATGIPIPLLKKHARINASDKETEQFAKEDGQGVGWVTKLDIGEDGGIVWEAKDVPEATAAEVKAGTLKLTSPEFRNHYTSEKEGVYSGPIIRHIAFTPLPGNPHQGPIEVATEGSTISSIALEETQDAWQFAEEERQPLPEQFSEHETLTKRGWKKINDNHGGMYEKGEHQIRLSGPTSALPNAFEHLTQGGKKSKAYHKKGLVKVLESIDSGSQHSEQEIKPIPPKETGTTADQYSEDSWTLPFADFLPWLQQEATEQFAHKEPADKAHASELMAVHSTKAHLPAEKMQYGASVHSMDMGKHQLAQQHDAIIKNLDHKKKKGTYDHEKSKKLWGYYAHSLNEYYKKHHGGGQANPATRHHVASILADHYHKGTDSTQHAEGKNPFDKDIEGAEVVEQPLPDVNPDMPPKTPDRNKLAAILAGLAQKNIVLPSDFDFSKEGALDILLGCLNSAIKAENETAAEMEPADPDNEPVTEAAMPFAEKHEWPKSLKHKGLEYRHTGKTGVHKSGSLSAEYSHRHEGKNLESRIWLLKNRLLDTSDLGGSTNQKLKKSSQHSETQTQSGDYIMQFSEEELAAMPPSVKAKLDAEVAAQKLKREEAESKAAQFAEEKQQQLNATALESTIRGIKTAPIPPGMKKELIDGIENLQFAEGSELPNYTTKQMVVLFAKYIPKHLQFTEEDVETSAPPKGRRVTGSDAKGNPVFEGEMGEQFFETSEIPSGHVSAERAEEIVGSSPIMRSQQRNSRLPTTGEDVARLNAEADKREYKGW